MCEGNMELEWKVSQVNRMTWDEAKSLEGSYRLPTLKELKEAYDNKLEGFDNRYYWTSIDSKDKNEYAWFFDFKQGIPYCIDKKLYMHVRLCKEKG